MPKDSNSKKSKRSQTRHNPLAADIESDRTIGVRLKKPIEPINDDEISDDEREKYVPKDLSRKLLLQVKQQQEEEQSAFEKQEVKKVAKEIKKSAKSTNRFEAIQDDSGEEEELQDSGSENEEVEEVEDIDFEDLEGQIELDPEDAKALSMFLPSSKSNEARKTLNDIIMERLLSHERSRAVQQNRQADEEMNPEKAFEAVSKSLNPKVVEAYSLIAKLMKHYTSGKLPKAFNIIPALNNWEEILYLTKPHEWSPPAVRAATRVFASNLNHHLAQRFYSLVLFPRIRDDIDAHKKLNWHLYMAMKKALYKPDAFYKGILLPICEAGDCTLREATIIASLLKRVSIPSAHSSVALYKIAQMPYSGANALFIGVLLNKKYALPYEVVDSIVDHFLRVNDEDGNERLPVLWHQSLLVFAQRYKNDLTAQQKEDLKNLIRRHHHHLISPEIRRELVASRNREDDPNTIIEEPEEPQRKRKPKAEIKPSFAMPGGNSANMDEDDDGSEDDDAMNE